MQCRYAVACVHSAPSLSSQGVSLIINAQQSSIDCQVLLIMMYVHVTSQIPMPTAQCCSSRTWIGRSWHHQLVVNGSRRHPEDALAYFYLIWKFICSHLFKIGRSGGWNFDRVCSQDLLDIRGVHRDLWVSEHWTNAYNQKSTALTYPCSPHNLDILTDPNDQDALLPERVLVVFVSNLGVGEWSILGFELGREFGKVAFSGSG